MRRRSFLVGVCGAVASPRFAAAAEGTKRKRLAIFVPSEPSADWHERSGKKYPGALFAELRRLGQIEGQNLIVESFGREQNTSGLEALATGIVDSNPDVVLLGGPGALIFKKLTSRIPIVTITGDPVRLGIAESLARPGGNFTGASIDVGPSIHGKRIELLREIYPAISKLGLLALHIQYNGLIKGTPIAAAAQKAGLPTAVSLLDVGAQENDWRAAVESLIGEGVNAVMVVDSPETFQNGALIAKLLTDAKIPAILRSPNPSRTGA